MATEIDSLQIRIVSNGENAANAISQVGAAVKGLSAGKRANQTVEFLRQLSDTMARIRTASTAASAIQTLANGVQSLKGVGSLTKAVGNIQAIAPAINALHSADLTGVSDKMSTLAQAMSHISGLKGLTSFGTAMRSLKDLPNITEKLTPEVLSDFADKVQRVSEAVTPLSNKMTSVAAGFKAINGPIRQASESTKDFSSAISNINIAAIISNLRTGYNLIRRILEGVMKLTDDVVDFDGIVERFRRGFGDTAGEAYSWIEKLNQEMGLNVQQFMQYTSIFAQMLEGLGVAQKDATQMAIGYSELSYDIWAAYNDIFESYGDAVSAVQSAIAGQTRPLRRAGFSVLNTTLAQTAANHGLEISIQGATEAEKSYLRYLALVDQAQEQGIIGTYAKEMETAEGQLRTLGQMFKSLTQEAGKLLLPLLTVVVPRVQAAVKLITEAIQRLAALFGVTLKTPEWSNSSGFAEAVEDAEEAVEGIESAMGGAAGSAKELKKTLLGIDEINQLNGANGGSSGGGGGGGSSVVDALNGYDWDVSSLWTDAIFKDINDQVDGLVEKIRGLVPEIAAAGSALLGLIAGAQNKPLIAIGIDFFVNGIMAFNAVNADNLVDSLMYILGGALATLGAGISLSRKFGKQTGWAIALGVAVVAQITGMYFALANGAEFGPGAIAQAIVTTLEGTAAGALLGFKLGGPAGAVFGAVIGAGLTIAIEAIAFTSAMNKAEFERRLAEDIHNRWGDDVGYTAKELRVMALNIMFDGNYDEQTVKMKANIMIERESMRESLANSFAQLNSDMFKLNVGIDVDESKIQQDVDEYIQAVRDYVDTSHADKQLSFSLLGISDSSLAQWENQQYTSNLDELERYYSLLREVTLNGTLTYDNITFEVDNRQAAVSQLNKMIQDLLDEAAQTKFEAQLSVLEFKYSGHMGKEDFEGLFAEAGAAYEEFQSAMYDSMEQAYSVAIDRRKEAIKNNTSEAEAWAQYYEDIMIVNEQYSGKLGDALLNTVDYAMSVLKEKYAEAFNDPAIDAAFAAIQEKIDYGLSIHPEDVIPSIDEYAEGMSKKINDIRPEVAAELQSIFDAMKPTVQQLQDLANWYTAAGLAVPDSIRNGINDLNKIGEMAGDISALEYKLGHDMLYQPNFYSMLLNTENAFSELTEAARNGIANNMSIVYDAAGNLVLQTSDGVQHQVDLTSPIIRANLEALGLVIPEGLAAGSARGTETYVAGANGIGAQLYSAVGISLSDKFKADNFKKYGQTIPNGVKSGASTTPSWFNPTVQSYQTDIQTAFRTYMSEKEWVKYGQAVPGGVKSGMGNGSDLNSHVSWLLKNISPNMDEAVRGMKNIGGNLVKGILQGMETESSSTETKQSLGRVMTNLDTHTRVKALIGSPSKLFAEDVGYWLTAGIVEGMNQPYALIEPMEVMYTNAKDWWDSNTTDITGGDFEFIDESGKNHYLDIKDANNEQNSLLREQNALLRAILEKESSGSYYGTSGEAMLEAASHLNRRTGRTMIPVGG